MSESPIIGSWYRPSEESEDELLLVVLLPTNETTYTNCGYITDAELDDRKGQFVNEYV